jgi:hypothetical protein
MMQRLEHVATAGGNVTMHGFQNGYHVHSKHISSCGLFPFAFKYFHPWKSV